MVAANCRVFIMESLLLKYYTLFKFNYFTEQNKHRASKPLYSNLQKYVNTKFITMLLATKSFHFY